MLLLSDVTGQKVLDAGGRLVGRVSDLTVQLGKDAAPHRVERILVHRRRALALILPWDVIEGLESGAARLRRQFDPASFAIASTADALASDEILLVRDVLDNQIVDVAGRRMVRVADVVLTRGSDARLEVVGVEVGFGAVLRRLGLRMLAPNGNSDVVLWADLHLMSRRGHAVQLSIPRSAVHHLDPAGTAALLSHLDLESASDILVSKDPDVAAGVVRAAHPVVGERMLRAMPSTNAEEIVAAMPAEHATRWRTRLARSPALRGRRFIRFRVWPRRRRTASSAATS